jgi:SUN domain-containing protein 1/2
MARTRAEIELIHKNTSDNLLDNQTNDVINSNNQTFNIEIAPNSIRNDQVNYEGRVNDLPSLEQIKTFFDKYNKIFKEFSIRHKILPIYYLSLCSPSIILILFISSPGNYEKSIMNENYKTNETPTLYNDSNLNDELFSTNYETISIENFNNKEIWIVLNKLNLKIFKLNEQIKRFQNVDQVSHQINKEIQNNLNIYDKNHETKHNNEKILINQKYGHLNQKIQNIELELKKLNDEVFILYSSDKNSLKKDSNDLNLPKSEPTNYLNIELNNLKSEMTAFKEYCTEKTKFQDVSFQKHQKRLIQELKYWIENIFISKSELIKYLNKNNETKFNIWNYISFKNQDQNKQNLMDMNQIKDLIKQSLYIYNADKTGMVDYALESTGAFVIPSRTSSSFNRGQPNAWLFGILPLPYYYNSPRLAIQPQVLPGECWAFKGSKGKLTIHLASKIFPTAFSIEHIPIVLAPNGRIDSAINEFSIFVYKDQNSKNSILIGNYQYDANSPEYLQYFPLQIENNEAIQVIEFRIESNHGNRDYTCIYRVRVHGILEE